MIRINKITFSALCLSLAVALNGKAEAETSVSDAYNLFNQVCLKNPLQTQKSMAAIEANPEFKVKHYSPPELGNVLSTFKSSKEANLGGGLREYKGLVTCNINFRPNGRGQDVAAAVAKKVSTAPGVSKQLPADAKRQYLFDYKGRILAVQYKRRQVSLILTNSQ